MDEINRNLSDSTPLMGIAINAILVFACLLLGGLPLRHSRVGLGFGAIGTILLAPLAGFGLSALLQVPGTQPVGSQPGRTRSQPATRDMNCRCRRPTCC